ncbi:solute carrier family 66 member 3 [Apus apus]|uniref:solute carrier family 66 member 3 n=1 Tax=Apus apus TaxID=8895 RepID=UPI0021F8C142|nr:solute carrier family 66 member 3 [Apus apus]
METKCRNSVRVSVVTFCLRVVERDYSTIRLALSLHTRWISWTATPLWSFLAQPKCCEGAIPSLGAVTRVYLFLFSFLVFLRYQIYCSYPLQTHLEYPIIIAQDVILPLFILHLSGSRKRALLCAIWGGGWYILTLRKWILDLAMVSAAWFFEIRSTYEIAFFSGYLDR